MPRPATVGPEIYKRVSALVAEGKRRTEAFAIVGEERGSSPGTVSANYYRVARSQNKGRGKSRATGPTGRRAPATTSPQRRQTPSLTASKGKSDIGQVAKEIVKLTQELVRHVEERDRRIRSLLG